MTACSELMETTHDPEDRPHDPGVTEMVEEGEDEMEDEDEEEEL